MGTPEFDIPCPDCIPHGVGCMFLLGGVGGSVFHFLKSFCTSPTGVRLLGGVHGVCMNAPRLGSAFSAWTMVYSTVQCSMQYIRQNDAPGLNSLVASAAASGFVRMRRGVGPATRLALVSGVFTTLLEFVEAQPVEIVRPATRYDDILEQDF